MLKKYILAAILINIYILTVIILFYGIINLELLSWTKLILIACLYGGSICLIIYTYLNKKAIIYNSGIFLTVLFSLITIFNIIELNNKYSYVENLYYQKYTYDKYSIYVNKSTTTYSNIKKLDGKKIGMLVDNSDNIQAYLNDIIDIDYYTYQNIDDLVNGLTSGEVQSIIIDGNSYNIIDKDYSKIKSKIRVIYTHKIKDYI